MLLYNSDIADGGYIWKGARVSAGLQYYWPNAAGPRRACCAHINASILFTPLDLVALVVRTSMHQYYVFTKNSTGMFLLLCVCRFYFFVGVLLVGDLRSTAAFSTIHTSTDHRSNMCSVLLPYTVVVRDGTTVSCREAIVQKYDALLVQYSKNIYQVPDNRHNVHESNTEKVNDGLASLEYWLQITRGWSYYAVFEAYISGVAHLILYTLSYIDRPIPGAITRSQLITFGDSFKNNPDACWI